MPKKIKSNLKDALNIPVVRVYLLATLLAGVAITFLTGSLGAAVMFAGWVGAFTAIIANELTPGHTLEGSWISRRKL